MKKETAARPHFEVEDQKLGRLKFFNVSEARSNFAEILQESARIVITRHGRPSKILIDYVEYQSLMEKAQSEPASPASSSEPTHSTHEHWTDEDVDQMVQSITRSISVIP